jgi:hypothetical protein
MLLLHLEGPYIKMDRRRRQTICRVEPPRREIPPQNIVKMLARDTKKLGNFGLYPASGRNHILPQQSTGVCRTTIRIALSNMNHD